jgi:hypothetical protein
MGTALWLPSFRDLSEALVKTTFTVTCVMLGKKPVVSIPRFARFPPYWPVYRLAAGSSKMRCPSMHGQIVTMTDFLIPMQANLKHCLASSLATKSTGRQWLTTFIWRLPHVNVCHGKHARDRRSTPFIVSHAGCLMYSCSYAIKKASDERSHINIYNDVNVNVSIIVNVPTMKMDGGVRTAFAKRNL